MKSKSAGFGKWVAAAALVGLSTMAQAFPVLNGGFESGDTNWAFSSEPPLGVNTSTGNSHAGQNSASYRGVDQDPAATVKQFVGLDLLHDYSLVFFLQGTQSALDSFSFAGLGLGDLDDVGPDPFGWVRYSVDISGSAGGVMEFRFDGAGVAFLDDVILRDDGCTNGSTLPNCGNGPNPMPEPGSLLLMGAALAGLGWSRRRKAL